MPRIYTSTSDPLVFCHRCFPKTEADAFEDFGNLGDGPDDRGNCFGYDTGSPSYECDEYDCHECGRRLNDRNG